MPRRENISVSFTPQQADFLNECVASGRYQSSSEVVREGLRLLQDQHERRKAEIERVRSMIQEAADEMDRGKTIDAATFFAEWDAELAALEEAHRQDEQ